MANKEDLARAFAGDKNLASAYLSGADLRGLDLRGADLRESKLWDADLSGADLRGADLSGADITDTDFSGADLGGSKLVSVTGSGANFTSARLVKADLTEGFLESSIFSSANLTGASLRQSKLNRANLSNANLTGAYVNKADLSGADLRRANLTGARIRDSDLTRSDLSNAVLTGARLDGSFFDYADLRAAKLTGANLTGASLRGGADLGGADLTGANLTGANLTGSRLRGARLVKANLRGAKLYTTNFYLATLVEANLTEANLTEADLTEADLTRADLSGADLTNADLTDAVLAEANIAGAVFTGVIGYAKQRIDLERRRTSGRATGAALKLAAADAPVDPREFKRRFPREFDLLARRGLAGRPFRPEAVAAIQKQLASPVEWVITRSRYTGSAQRYCAKANDVLLLNIDLGDSSLTDSQRTSLRQLAAVSRRSGHPYEKGSLFTIGWVRYCVGPDAWLIEEVQSDVQVARTGLKDPAAREELASAGIDAESFEEAVTALAPYTEAFYHDAIGLVFEMARAAGVEVEMLSHESKREFGSPRNVYTDLPREMGMQLRKGSQVLSSDGQVWAYRPNPARRRKASCR